MEIVRETAQGLRSEATSVDERRLLVASGSRARASAVVETIKETIGNDDTVVVSDRGLNSDELGFDHTGELLGTTHDCIVVDCHDTYRPNAIGQATGAVDGGGLLVLLTPPLNEWPDTNGRFDEVLAPPPFSATDAGNLFKHRLIRTLSTHRGVAIVDTEAKTLLKRGRTDPPRRPPPKPLSVPDRHAFPATVYEACQTVDQRDAVHECERLIDPGTAVVLEADRGRGIRGGWLRGARHRPHLSERVDVVRASRRTALVAGRARRG
jgi:tRNA(Met) cytidine acetyltransferase